MPHEVPKKSVALMDRRIYTLQKIAQNLKATIVNFPITFGGVPLDKKDGTRRPFGLLHTGKRGQRKPIHGLEDPHRECC